MAETLYRRAKRMDNCISVRCPGHTAYTQGAGLFLLMQSLPEDWTYTISGLAAKSQGPERTRSAPL